jgi:hypothetical protein
MPFLGFWNSKAARIAGCCWATIEHVATKMTAKADTKCLRFIVSPFY